MLYYVHNPRGNIVIRTNNPLIAVRHQKSGWLTATSLDELFSERPEWQPSPNLPSAWRKATELVSRACGSVLASFSPTLALAPSYTPSGAAAVISLLNNNEGASRDGSAPAERFQAIANRRLRNGGSARNAPGTEPAGKAHNSAPLSWMTALECRWYRDRGLQVPEAGWLECTEGNCVVRYKLLFGVWDLGEDTGCLPETVAVL